MKNDSRARMVQHRESRRADGYRETTVWLGQDHRERLDLVVRSGSFRNRSEAVSAAIDAFLKEESKPEADAK